MNKGKEKTIHIHYTKKRSGNRNYRKSFYFLMDVQQIQRLGADLGLEFLQYFLKESMGLHHKVREATATPNWCKWKVRLLYAQGLKAICLSYPFII